MPELLPRPGYACASSMRHPADPDVVVLSQDDCDSCTHVGFATIDGARCAVFRTTYVGGLRYVFQLERHCK